MASTFMPRVADASSPGDLLQAAPLDEDLFVAFNQGLLVRHRLLLAPQPPQQRGYSPQDPAPESPARCLSAHTSSATLSQCDTSVLHHGTGGSPQRQSVLLPGTTVSGVLPVCHGESRLQAAVVLAHRAALLACSREEGGTELAVEAVEQWDVCRRRSWPERSAPCSCLQSCLYCQAGRHRPTCAAKATCLLE